MNSTIRRGLAAASFLICGSAFAAIDHISSASGFVLDNSGGNAVTANWQGQSRLQGFTGYGQIKYNGQCLTGRQGGQPLRWENCAGRDPAQTWSLQGRKLNNEGGWCADVEGARNGAGVRVLAYKCSGAGNQQWNAHRVEAASTAAARISNPAVRAEFLKNAQSARAGAVISTSTGKLVAAGGGNLVAAGGGNLVAAGGGNLVAAGGGN